MKNKIDLYLYLYILEVKILKIDLTLLISAIFFSNYSTLILMADPITTLNHGHIAD